MLYNGRTPAQLLRLVGHLFKPLNQVKMKYIIYIIVGLVVGHLTGVGLLEYLGRPTMPVPQMEMQTIIKVPANLQEYQIRLEPDSAYIYDNGRLVGSCKHGSDGIDSVIVMDNL